MGISFGPKKHINAFSRLGVVKEQAEAVETPPRRTFPENLFISALQTIFMKKTFGREKTISSAIIILFLISGALSLSLLSMMSELEKIRQVPAIQQSLKLQDIVSGLQKLNETRDYPLLLSLQEIAPQDVEQLKKQQPVIYNQLPERTLYSIVLANSTNSSVFLIYDLEGGKILRMFDLSRMSLG